MRDATIPGASTTGPRFLRGSVVCGERYTPAVQLLTRLIRLAVTDDAARTAAARFRGLVNSGDASAPRLPAEQVVWLVLGMALMRDRPMHDVMAKLDLALPGRSPGKAVATSTITKARQRVGYPSQLPYLFTLTATSPRSFARLSKKLPSR